MKQQSFSKNNFNLKKWIIYFVVGLIWLFFVGMLVYTSWYDNDVLVTKTLGDLGWQNWLGVISEYIVMDGYFTLVNFMVPLVILLFESLIAYLKIYLAKKKVTQHLSRNHHVYGFSLNIIWLGVMVVLGYFFFLRDLGFGLGIDPETFFPLVFSAVTFSLIILINSAISWSLSWYVMYRLATKPDFLENEYWKKTIKFIVFFLVLYLMVVFLKAGFKRPLYYQTVWADRLDWLKTHNFKMWEYYMNQTDFNYGWLVNSANPDGYANQSWQSLPGDWPWWKVAPGGWFYSGSDSEKVMMNVEDAFPSGHLATSMLLLYGAIIYAYPKKTVVKTQWKVMAITLGIGYNLAMFLCLGFSYGHWMSDMAFTFAYAGPMYFFSEWIGMLMTEKWLISFHEKYIVKGSKNKTKIEVVI